MGNKSMSKKKYISNMHRRDGQTLVEAVIAILLLSMCMYGVCRLVIKARQMRNIARIHYTAVNVAKNRLERARNFDFDSLDTLSEDTVTMNADGGPSPDGDYQRTTIVSNINSVLKELVVTVGVRDKISRTFEGEAETVQSLFTHYLEPIE